MSKRELQKESTRNSILNAAIKLFTQKSIRAVSVAEIAKEANVAKGSVFHHFENKEGLSLNVLKYIMNIFMEDFEDLVEKVEKYPDTFNQEFKSSLLKMFDLEMHLHTFNFIMDYLHVYGMDMKNLDQSLLMEFEKYISKFNRIMSLGKINKPEIRSLMFFSMIDGILLQLELNPLPSDDIIPFLVDELMMIIEFWQNN